MSKRADIAASIKRNQADCPLCIIAACPGCDQIVAGHVIDRSCASDDDFGNIVFAALDGYRVEVICGPVIISPCRCDQ